MSFSISKFVMITSQLQEQFWDFWTRLKIILLKFSLNQQSEVYDVESTSFLFLVGAFSFKEKSPTITVASFFFVRPQSSSRMYHFLQKLISSLRPSSTNANLLQRVPLSFFTFFT